MTKPAAKMTAKTKSDAPAHVYVGAQNEDGSAKEAQRGHVSADTPNAAPQGFVPKIAKVITLPLLKMRPGEPLYVKFTAPHFVGKRIKEDLATIEENKALVAAGKPAKPVKEPPVMANVINLPTGELVQIMLGSVLVGILADDYPGDAYVGKGFLIELKEQKRGRNGGNYNTYKVAELDLDK